MSDPITILVVDDHGVLLRGLGLLLEAEADMHVVGQAQNADAALEIAESQQPQIILLDITLQNSSGLDLIETFKVCSPASSVIMLTMHDNKQYMQKAMEKGARGFVLKKGIDQDLLYAVRAVMRGDVYVHPSLLADYIPTSRTKPNDGTQGDEGNEAMLWTNLSAREQEVLSLVAHGFTSKEIAQKCFLSEKTVATYRSRGMIKLDLTSRADLVSMVLKLGKMDTSTI